MSTSPADAAQAPLQFDSALSAESAPAANAAPCAKCGQTIAATYYTNDGNIVCPSCRHWMESERTRGTGAGRFARALLFGSGGAVAGAALYFTVMAVTGYEIGLIAIAVGWLVGLGVSRGARGNGGRRYQVLAVLLAYLAIDATYFGYFVKESIKNIPSASADSTAVAGAAAAPAASAASANATAARDSAAPAAAAGTAGVTAGSEEPSPVLVLGFLAALPIIANLSNLPQGLIGLLIIFFALSQAWQMNALRALAFEGPFRTGGPEPAPAGA